MAVEVLLSIIGGFLVLMLGINGYFLRGIFQDLNAVKLQLAVSIEASRHKEKRLDALEKEVKEIKLNLQHIQ